jgi:hypothetical protein
MFQIYLNGLALKMHVTDRSPAVPTVGLQAADNTHFVTGPIVTGAKVTGASD